MNFKTDEVQIVNLDDGALWIKHVFERLYVINGYYVYFATDIDNISDSALADLFYRFARIFLQTYSTDNGDVCFLYKFFNLNGELRYTIGRRDISVFDVNILRKARGVLNEYRSWASNSD